MNKISDKIICAIDTNDFAQVTNLINEVSSEIQTVKFGLEFFIAFGIEGVKRIINLYPNIKIFLDLKFHDIPNTVFGALKSIVTIPNIFLTTIHASGGKEMIKKAKDTVRDSNSQLKIIAVTRLTSLEVDLEQTLALTDLALNSGADGIVCPAELCKAIRLKFTDQYNNFIIVTPGIRLNNSSIDDQKTVSTPKQAIANGADYLVIGRPITQSINKIQTIRDILGDMM
jgi:orotidine-5'-phosphate decarboxylase